MTNDTRKPREIKEHVWYDAKVDEIIICYLSEAAYLEQLGPYMPWWVYIGEV